MRFREILDYLTSKWWFYLLLLIIGFFLLPPYSSVGYSYDEMGEVIAETLSNAIIYSLVDMIWPSLLIHIIFILIIIAIIRGYQKAVLLFNVFCSIIYFMIAIGQGTGISGKYGLVIIIGNVFLILLVALTWVWECFVQRNKLGGEIRKDHLWLVPFAIFAFWSPPYPKLDLLYLLRYLGAGYFGVAYCLTTPVILTILLLYYPNINKPVLRLTAFIGLCFAIINVLSPIWSQFIFEVIWTGTILHIPLLVTCAYSLILSIKK